MSEIQPVYGMFNLREKRELAEASYEYITNDVNDMKTNAIRFGFHLMECKENKYYEDYGFNNFYEFVEKNWKLEKSAVSRYINLFMEFSLCQNGQHKMFLDNKYEGYSYSQLSEMLPLSSNQRKQIKPEMTVTEIRELKKSWKKKDKVVVEKNATSQQQEEIVLDVEYQEIAELPTLKNDNQRKEFIENYSSWQIWIDLPQTGERYWKYELDNGIKLVVKAVLRKAYLGYQKGYSEEKTFGAEEYYLFENDKSAYEAKTNKSGLVQFLKDYQKK